MRGPTTGRRLSDGERDILNERRADAAPTAEEARREHRRWLSDQGCEVCGDDDPDRLDAVLVPMAWGCPAHQMPPEPWERTILCDDHRRHPKLFERAYRIQQARRNDADFLVIHACGSQEYAQKPDPDELKERRHNRRDRLSAKRHLVCLCGEPIDEVIEIDTDL